jgi:hypothetical protein
MVTPGRQGRQIGMWLADPCHEKEAAVEDKTPHEHVDRKLIRLKQDYEMRYWTQVLGVSRADLIEAVRNAGVSVPAVRAYLARQR